jgi:hypothetical protein
MFDRTIKPNNDLSVFNDIDTLYEKSIIEDNGKFICPVCGKSYKTEKGAKNHMSKRDCFSYLVLIKDTMLELTCYSLYKLLVAEMGTISRVSVTSFRKSGYYKAVAKFVIFCKLHEVKDINSYLRYINSKGVDSVHALLKVGVKETTLREYRIYLQKNPEEIDSVSFFEKYADYLETDDKFLIRSIEKGHISLLYLVTGQNQFDIDERIEGLPIDYQNRIFEVSDQIIQS